MHANQISKLFSLRMIVVVSLIGIFLYMISTVYRYGLADIKHYQVTSMLNQSSKSRENSDLKNWREIRLMLQQINGLHPDNPYYLELLAKVGELHGKQSRGEAAEILYRQALGSLEGAIKLRVVSPYTWANIAKIKAILGEFDEEFLIAVESAVKFGPWIQSIQQAVAVISFRYWEQLPEEIKPLMIDNLRRAAQIQQKSLFNLAEKHESTQLLCSLVALKFRPCAIN